MHKLSHKSSVTSIFLFQFTVVPDEYMGAMLTSLVKHCARSSQDSPSRRILRNLVPRASSAHWSRKMAQVLFFRPSMHMRFSKLANHLTSLSLSQKQNKRKQNNNNNMQFKLSNQSYSLTITIIKGTGHDFCWSGKPIYHLQKQGNKHVPYCL